MTSATSPYGRAPSAWPDLLGAVATGAVAGALWMLGCLLAPAAHQHLGRVSAFVLPATPGGSSRLLAMTEPWITLNVLSTSLAVALLVAAAALLVAHLAAGRAVRVILVWASVMAAGVLGSAGLLSGALLDHQSSSSLWSQTAAEVLAGLGQQGWALFLGWIPALLALREGPAARAIPGAVSAVRPDPRLSAALAALVGVIAVIGGAGVSAEGSAAYRQRIESESRSAPQEQEPSTPDLGTSGILAPVSGFGEASSDCVAGDLVASPGAGDAAMGQRVLTLVVQNTGRSACTLSGYPGVGFESRTAAPLGTDLRPGAESLAVDRGPVPVPLTPGGYAIAQLTWRTNSVGAESEAVGAILLSPTPAGGDAARYIFPQDIVRGAEVYVTAWSSAEPPVQD